jgi:hypothetical protein
VFGVFRPAKAFYSPFEPSNKRYILAEQFSFVVYLPIFTPVAKYRHPASSGAAGIVGLNENETLFL